MSNKTATGQPTMTDEQVAAWVEMAKDRTLQAWLSDGQYKRALARQVARGARPTGGVG
jgi:hypothetical protein